MKQKLETSSEKPLVCHSQALLWGIVAALMAFPILIPISDIFNPRPYQDVSDYWFTVVFAATCGIAALCLAFYNIRLRITADAHGLTFQSLWKRTFVPWNQIEDFELRAASTKQSQSQLNVAYLKIGAHWKKISRIPSRNDKPHDALLERIAREARWSRTRQWQLAGLRTDGDWPKTFEYRDSSGWRLVGTFLSFSSLFLGYCLFEISGTGGHLSLTNFVLLWENMSGRDRIELTAKLYLHSGGYPLIILAGYPAIRARRAYLDRKVEVSLEGLTFHRENGHVFVPWNEVLSYHLEHNPKPGLMMPKLYVVETSSGRYEFVHGISDERLLRSLIQEFARNVITPQWRYLGGADEDVLGGASSLWRSGKVGDGPKIHHHRTRSLRIMLIAGWLVGTILWGSVLVPHSRRSHPLMMDDYLGIALFFVPLSLAVLYGTFAYFRTEVQCEESGLRQTGVFAKRFIPWSEIQRVTYDGNFFTVSGAKCKIHISVMIADFRGLGNEIEGHSGVKIEAKRKIPLD